MTFAVIDAASDSISNRAFLAAAAWFFGFFLLSLFVEPTSPKSEATFSIFWMLPPILLSMVSVVFYVIYGH